MSYTALYRKFRPDTFEDVKGQDSIVTTLKNQIRSGRIGHAYLFCGTRGTGKTSVAKLFAKAVNCESPVDADPCGKCASCVSAASGASANIIEIDAASNNSVDDVRNIREEVAYRPTEGKYKVYIIDEAHMLSAGAFNALLKTLEEPPEYVIFILATTEAAKLPVTIVSRCQRYDFKRISIDVIAERLNELLEKEGVQAEEKGIRYISRLAEGSLRDALSLLERCVSGSRGGLLRYEEILETLGNVDSEAFREMLSAIRSNDISRAVRSLEQYSVMGKDMATFVSGFIWYLRNLLLSRNADGIEDLLDVTSEEFELLKQQATGISDEELMRYIRILSEVAGKLRNSVSRRVDVELALIRLCRPQMESDDQALALRIRELEQSVEDLRKNGAAVSSAAKPSEKQEQPAAETKERPRKKAAPEQLKKIRQQWQKIVSGMGSGAVKAALENAEPSYNSMEDDPVFYLSVSNATNKGILEKSEEQETLRAAIETAAEGTVEIRIVCPEDRGVIPGLARIETVEKLQQKIHHPIEVEE